MGHIKRSQQTFGQSKYSIMNEGENIISAILSDSQVEAVSEMGMLQFASRGRGKAVMYSFALQAVKLMQALDFFGSCIYFH